MEFVALLAEGVDRNKKLLTNRESYGVALLAEGVDRNYNNNEALAVLGGRPPRGGRG